LQVLIMRMLQCIYDTHLKYRVICKDTQEPCSSTNALAGANRYDTDSKQ
jgi:hypothetical protein